MDAAELAAFADSALDGLEHRRIDFELIEPARARRSDLERLGWKATSLLWMHHRDPSAVAAGEEIEVEEAPYEAADALRLAWHLEDSDGVRVRRVLPRGRPRDRDEQGRAASSSSASVASRSSFAQLERFGDGAEISQVYVHPDHRGQGRGTAMTRAAIAASADARDVWIVADDEDRPKRLYERLGFRPVHRSMELLRLR